MHGLTERERHARELAAKALSLGSDRGGLARAAAGDTLLDELCEWLRTMPALNEEVVQAALPKLRARAHDPHVVLPVNLVRYCRLVVRHAVCS